MMYTPSSIISLFKHAHQIYIRVHTSHHHSWLRTPDYSNSIDVSCSIIHQPWCRVWSSSMMVGTDDARRPQSPSSGSRKLSTPRTQTDWRGRNSSQKLIFKAAFALDKDVVITSSSSPFLATIWYACFCLHLQRNLSTIYCMLGKEDMHNYWSHMYTRWMYWKKAGRFKRENHELSISEPLLCVDFVKGIY